MSTQKAILNTYRLNRPQYGYTGMVAVDKMKTAMRVE
jgi:hypothetical protein